MNSKASDILQFIHLCEGLKTELRHGHNSAGRRESVADHSWRVALMVMICGEFLSTEISLKKAIEMAIIHDLAEVITGDQPYFVFEESPAAQEAKYAAERQAEQELTQKLPERIGLRISGLWDEYRAQETCEAKLVKAMDKLEAQLQHNEMDYKFWNDYDRRFALTRLNKSCSFDEFLVELMSLAQRESAIKMQTEVPAS